MEEQAPPKKKSRLDALMAGTAPLRAVDEEKSDGGDLKPWHVRANDVLTFHLVDEPDQIEASEGGTSFPPSYTHQVFREDETIRGYEGLKIDVWLQATTMQAFVDVRHDRKMPAFGAITEQPDDVVALLKDKWPSGFARDPSEFKAKCATNGEVDLAAIGQVVPTAGEKAEVRHAKLSDEKVRELHARMEPLILFLIDGSSFIDLDDNRWELLLLVEKSGDKQKIAGYATLYRFYAHPNSARIRLSQVVIFPPFQGQGYGSTLIEATHAIAVSSQALDVTVEDPTVDLQRLRDVHDLKRLLTEPKYKEAAVAALNAAATNGGDLDSLKTPVSLLKRAQAEFKICHPQMKRCWDALLFLEAQQTPSLVPLLRRYLKHRLQAEFFSSERKKAEGKKVIETASGFLMFSGFKGTSVQMESGEANEAQQQEEALQQLLEESWSEFERLSSSLECQMTGQ
eukprot:CAMPEP_0183830558 /NCGR_PEP_ID=MMETSP0807_2-20130328/4086_1 /TAXON_ID=88271 /ORGANISM="Picocystis salinarum, Strain CCMP1897" /LENGTH=454 /DNA_ID=CAMNT_0026075931 /DNA_START=20 /DNA_END=1384 /DNA_ORIENTATION=+